MGKPLLCLDFDSCIHSYKSPWEGPYIIPDPVVPGFEDWAMRAKQQFRLAVYGPRSVNIRAVERMQEWFKSQGMEPGMFQFPLEPPPAFLTIGARVVQFRGDWSDGELDIDSLRGFKPWNRV
jgi:hypothetical protein